MTIAGRSLLLALAAALAAGCRGSTEPKGTKPPVLTQLPRNLSAAEAKVVSAANSFTFALFREVAAAEQHESVFISPLSASFSLGMTLNGARTGTFDAMRDALQFGGTSQAEINSGYRGIIDLLQGLDESVKFTIANSIWYRNTFAVSPAFLDAGRTYFDAKIEGLDFDNATASLATINAWVNEKTAGRIPSILDEIRPEHVMFLANAIYFKGSWRTQFDPSKTQAAPFTSSTGAVQQAQMMTFDDTISYATVSGAEVVDLPYGNKAYSMTVVLPPQGTSLDAFAGALTEAQWQSYVTALQPRKAPLYMPKLKMSYERTLNPDLTALGMGVAFSDLADLSGIPVPGGPPLSIAFVKQKAYVDINEEGTEAAAVTVTGIQVTSAPMPVRIDRPYLFAIRERLTGTILFVGKVNRMP